MIDMTDCRDLTSLQTMLFIVLFLQSSARLSTCYSYIGIVLRSAIRMGLHRSVPNTFDPIEVELRKRIWWIVRKLDTYVGALLGLPQMLDNDDIDQEMPKEIDDDYITKEGILPMPPGRLSVNVALNAHTKLVDILAKTVKYIYPIKGTAHAHGKAGHSYAVSHAKIREIEADLQRWMNNLPEEFKPGDGAAPEFMRHVHFVSGIVMLGLIVSLGYGICYEWPTHTARCSFIVPFYTTSLKISRQRTLISVLMPALQLVSVSLETSSI